MATVKGFKGDPSLTVISLERNGNVVHLTADPALAGRLVARFGVVDGEEFTSMEAIIGMRCRWTEDRVGVLVALEPLAN